MTGSSDQPVRRDNPAEVPHTGPLYPYPPGYLPPPPPVAPKNGFGVAALVLAVVGLLAVATVLAPIALGAIAVVAGAVGHGRAKRGTANNDGVAIAGIVLGALAIVVGVAFIAIWMAVWKDVRGGDYIACMQKAGNDPAAEQHCADQFRHSVQDRLHVSLTPASTR